MSSAHWKGVDLIKEWQDYGVFGCVEATRCEKHYLWLDNAEGAADFKFSEKDRVKWEYGSIGLFHVVKGKDFDTNVSVFCDLIEGKAVIFWECVSLKCDYAAAEKWVKETFKPKSTSDAMNFHHILYDIHRLTSAAV